MMQRTARVVGVITCSVIAGVMARFYWVAGVNREDAWLKAIAMGIVLMGATVIVAACVHKEQGNGEAKR